MFNLDIWGIPPVAFILLAVLLFVAIVGIIVFAVSKSKKKKKEISRSGVEFKDGERVSVSDSTERYDGSAVVSYVNGDYILNKNVTYTAGRYTQLPVGKYTVLTAAENSETFNVRLNGIVSEFKHGQGIVLGEGDTICAVSCSIILR